jgi:hypothetical protein
MNAFKRDKKEEEEGKYETQDVYQWHCLLKLNALNSKSHKNYILGRDGT